MAGINLTLFVALQMQYMTPYIFLFLFILDKICPPKGLKTALYMCDVFYVIMWKQSWPGKWEFRYRKTAEIIHKI